MLAARVFRRNVSVKVSVISDSVCPWCYVGKKGYEAALASMSPAPEKVEAEWRPYFLNPNLPPEGYSVVEFWQRETGVPEKFLRGPRNPLNVAAKKVGLELNYDRRVVNTITSHCLAEYAKEFGMQDAMVEEMFRIFFINAEDISKKDVLIEAAKRVGVPEPEKAFRDEVADQVREEEVASKKAIKGVPHFTVTVDGKSVELHGAQSEESFREALQGLWPAAPSA